MVKKLLIGLVLLLSCKFGVAQQERKTVVREVLLVRHFQGEYRLPAASDSILNLSQALDSYSIIMLPYNKRADGMNWPFENYLMEFYRNPYVYLYNEIFLSLAFLKEPYQELLKKRGLELPEKYLVSALPKDQVFVRHKQRGLLANIWILEAEWEQITVKDKPEFIKGLTPNTLIFDHYDLFLLRKVLRATSAQAAPDGYDRSFVEFRKDIAPRGFSSNY